MFPSAFLGRSRRRRPNSDQSWQETVLVVVVVVAAATAAIAATAFAAAVAAPAPADVVIAVAAAVVFVAAILLVVVVVKLCQKSELTHRQRFSQTHRRRAAGRTLSALPRQNHAPTDKNTQPIRDGADQGGLDRTVQPLLRSSSLLGVFVLSVGLLVSCLSFSRSVSLPPDSIERCPRQAYRRARKKYTQEEPIRLFYVLKQIHMYDCIFVNNTGT